MQFHRDWYMQPRLGPTERHPLFLTTTAPESTLQGQVFPFHQALILLFLPWLDAPRPSDRHLSYPSPPPLSLAPAFSLLFSRAASTPPFS